MRKMLVVVLALLVGYVLGAWEQRNLAQAEYVVRFDQQAVLWEAIAERQWHLGYEQAQADVAIAPTDGGSTH